MLIFYKLKDLNSENQFHLINPNHCVQGRIFYSIFSNIESGRFTVLVMRGTFRPNYQTLFFFFLLLHFSSVDSIFLHNLFRDTF